MASRIRMPVDLIPKLRRDLAWARDGGMNNEAEFFDQWRKEHAPNVGEQSIRAAAYGLTYASVEPPGLPKPSVIRGRTGPEARRVHGVRRDAKMNYADVAQMREIYWAAGEDERVHLKREWAEDHGVSAACIRQAIVTGMTYQVNPGTGERWTPPC